MKPLLLSALEGEPLARPPVWMMRQAGRYLPEYMALRKKYDFFSRVETPELAAEITLQPIKRLGVDAAILFSDILVIPKAMGQQVQMVESKGPFLPETIKSERDIDALLHKEEAVDALRYVYDAVSLTKRSLPAEIPLIGFAGAPFTLLCYMVEGQGSKTFSKAKEFCFKRPDLAHKLLSKITEVAIRYLQRKVSAGADVVQLFDSWSGLLGPREFARFAQPYLEKIAEALSAHAPVILFPKGSWYALEELSTSKASAIGLDWTVTPAFAKKATNSSIALQGNFDPSKLLMPIKDIEREARQMVRDFGTKNFIANLGHGILPGVPVDHAIAFVDSIKNFNA